MVQAEGTERRPRRFRSVSEKRRIVELTLAPGASVALVARAHGVNANQVFKWRRAFDRGELGEPATVSTALLPVTVSAPSEAAMRALFTQQHPASAGSIRIDFPGRVTISVESGADPALLRSILESLHK
jgi:transposase